MLRVRSDIMPKGILRHRWHQSIDGFCIVAITTPCNTSISARIHGNAKSCDCDSVPNVALPKGPGLR